MVTRARLARYRSLLRAKARREEGRYLAEGRRLVSEAIVSGVPVETVLVTEEFRETTEGRRLEGEAKTRSIAVESISAKELGRIADTKTPQGVIAVLHRVEAEETDLRARGLILALDGVSDPGNAGTLVRAGDAFDVGAVLAGPGTADLFGPKTLRSAMGSTFHVPLYRTADLPGRLRHLREEGARVLAATLDGEDLYAANTGVSCVVLVLGSEAHGVSTEARDAADAAVTVPCPGRAESLNVAMAGAIALAHLSRTADGGGES